MFLFQNDLEKLKSLRKTRFLHRPQKNSRRNAWEKDFQYHMKEVFGPFTENRKQNQIQTKLEAEKQIQALRDSTQTTKQAIKDQTRAKYQSSNASTNTLQKSIEDGIQEFDEITNRNN